jgi:RNA polymerase sigma-70 factor, ECF subfamily
MPTTSRMPETRRPEFTPEVDDLFRQHSQFVYKTAFVVTRSPEDAEDVLQTLFLRLMRRRVPPTFLENPRRYLYVAAVNLSLNTIRSRRRQVLIGDVQSFDRAQDSSSPEADNPATQRLHRAIATLPARTVEILILRYVHDYTEQEIAGLLGRTRGTIAVTLFRCRNRLRKLMLASAHGESR